MEDLSRYLGAVTRQVKTVDRDGKPATSVIAIRDYDTNPDDLWDALTNAERIPRWFLPIEGELKLGGRYALKGNASGTVLTCEPPRFLEITWEYAGEVSWVNVTLQPRGAASTNLRLEHVAHVPEEFWNQFGPGAVGVGWDLGLMGLALHIDTGSSVPPEENEAWTASPDGRNFMRASSDDWCRAVIANGADPAWAKEAAERTRMFYSGEQPPGAAG
jgi:uncharacterized protein YndB with AHSA1/START domain